MLLAWMSTSHSKKKETIVNQILCPYSLHWFSLFSLYLVNLRLNFQTTYTQLATHPSMMILQIETTISMKKPFLIVLTLAFFSCHQQTDQTKELQNQINSLEIQLANTYKPGFGDFMGSIQKHHSKLWFAGQYENWNLADFEVHEIMETIEDIEIFQKGRKETELIGMIIPPLDSIRKAIDQKNLTQFKSSFAVLTNTCNQCHQATEMEFNVVKIPEVSAFSNQDFEPKK